MIASRLLFSFFLSGFAQAIAGEGPGAFSYEGRLYDDQGNAVTAATVNFRVQVYDANASCILYEESFVKDLSATQGLFSLKLGSGSASPTYLSSLRAAMANTGLSQTVSTCTYTATNGSDRKVKIAIMDSHNVPSEFTEFMSIGSAAYAMSADSLQGLLPGDFVQVRGATRLTQANIESLFTNIGFDNLSKVAAGQFIAGSASGAALPNVTSVPSTAPAAGTIWYDTQTAGLKFSTGSAVVSLASSNAGVTSITAGTGLTGGIITTTGTIAVAPGGIGTSEIADAAITSSKLATSLSVTNTLAAPTVNTRTLILTGADGHRITLQAPGTTSADTAYTLPANTGTAGQLLSTDGSGGLSWTNTSGVTSVGLSLPAIFDVTFSPVTSTGLLTASLRSQNAGIVFAGPPSGGAAAPTFRSLASTDLPADGYSTTYARLGGNSLAAPAAIGTKDNFGFSLRTSNIDRVTIDSSGLIGVGTSAPATRLDVNGGIRVGNETSTCSASLYGTIRLNGTTLQACGTSGWAALGAGASAAGLTSLNGLTAATQDFAIGTTGLQPNWQTTGLTTHVLNVPNAGTSGVTAGLISNTQYQLFNSKMADDLSAGQVWVGNSSNKATAVSVSGDAAIASNGTMTVKGLQGQAVKAGVLLTNADDAKVLRWTSNGGSASWTPGYLNAADLRTSTGLAQMPTTACSTAQTMLWNSLTDVYSCQSISISSSQISFGNAAAKTVFAGPTGASGAPAFRTLELGDLPAGTATQWTSNGSNIYYASGNIGIGTTSPVFALDVSGAVRIAGSTPRMILKSTVALADRTAWDVFANPLLGLQYRAVNDADSSGTTYMQVNRTNSTVISSVGFPAGPVAIGSSAATFALEVYGSGFGTASTAAILFPREGSVNRPSAVNGLMRYSSDANYFEAVENGAWTRVLTAKAGFLNGGNAFGSNASIGTRDAYGLNLKTLDTPRLSITNDGLVGIGTTTPTSTLEVQGGTAPSGAGRNITLSAQNAGAGTFRGGNIILMPGASTGGEVPGGVGIGTSSAQALLHVTDMTDNPSIQIGHAKANAIPSLYFSSQSGYSVIQAATDGSIELKASADTVNFRKDNGNIVMAVSPNANAVLDLRADGSQSAMILPRAGTTQRPGTPVDGMLRYNNVLNQIEARVNGSWEKLNTSSSSDIRLKKSIEPVLNALELTDQLRPVTYYWDEANPRANGLGSQREIGFIAQELERVLPEVVNVGADGYRTVEYGKIISLAVGAIKELKAKLGATTDENLRLKSEVESLKAESAKAKQDVDVMKAYLCSRDLSAPWCAKLGN